MKKTASQLENPLILRYHRLMDAFAKSDDERDFYLNRLEGYLIYVDLDKPKEELDALYKEIETHVKQYCLIPKMTFYEVKKFMEGFVNEKVYDIDTKEKLLDIISSKEARENFLEFLYDHLTELEKWQQYYQERSRVRIIEWLRKENILFVFEEDVDVPRSLMEKVKRLHLETKVPKEVAGVRDTLRNKAKTYYSNEALNPRPKRGRPPKQTVKVEIEPQFTADIYVSVPPSLKRFLYIPDITSPLATFSAKFETEEQLLASLRGTSRMPIDEKLEALSQRLESLRHLSEILTHAEKKFGLETASQLFQPFARPKFKEGTSFELGKAKEGEKVESAIEEVITTKKRGRPKKRSQEKAEETVVSSPRRGGFKKVAPIQRKKDKSQEESR